jgi:acetyl-CoA carboxylase, biotin carboxylase subunit
MIKKCLIANRGEIALRIATTCKKMGIKTVVAYSLCDKQSLAVSFADESVCIGPNAAELSYKNMDHLLEAALLMHCDAIHPGYGFLSENADFAKKVEDCGLIFIGPSSSVLHRLSQKNVLKEIVQALSIPVIAGSFNDIDSLEDALSQASSIGYPLMLKPSVGGGGSGIKIISDEEILKTEVNRLKLLGFGPFYLEKYIPQCRHIEVQILADKHQNIIHLSTRNCTIQNRYQKMIEEAPFSVIDPFLHKKVVDVAICIAKHIQYDHIGTVEFLIDENDQVFFMEINPRIQVEHPVTEMITHIDIVEQQILIASGCPLSYKQDDIRLDGYAIECRINAQDERNDFMPSSGTVTHLQLPEINDVRVDTALFKGYSVPTYYDSLIVKVIAWGKTREQARLNLSEALSKTAIEGIFTNLNFLRYILDSDRFVMGNYNSELFPSTYKLWKNHQKNNSSAGSLGSFHLCPQCAKSLSAKQLSEHQNVCEFCGHHFRISASRRIADLIDPHTFIETDADAKSDDFNAFLGYEQKLQAARISSGLNEAVITGLGKWMDHPVCIGVLDASFMMGSMGHIVGDKITRLIEMATDMCCPLIIISASGGARMQEGIISLMQMAKTAAALHRFDQSGNLFISVFTHPTTGGVSASFAMLGDILISEPKALIGFAGRRVIEKTIKESLPQVFQTAEYLLEHGFLDMITDRRNLRQVIGDILNIHQRRPYER